MPHFQQRTSARPADLAIDLGTANTLVVERGSGLLFDQPSVCCFRGLDALPEFVAAGAEAQSYVGKLAKPLKIVRPLRNGVLSDIDAARELIRFAIASRRRMWRLARPRAIIGVPADATAAERRALATAAVDAGLAPPRLVAEPLLSAIGLGFRVDQPRGRMVVDCGAGTTEVAVISLGDICLSHSVRGGSEALDQALVDHLHLRHRFQIGPATAERLKLELSSRLERGAAHAVIEIRGHDAVRSVPTTIAIPADELMAIWDRHCDAIVAAVRAALSETPPELSQDILEDGIVLTGGGAMTGLLARRITEASGIKVAVAEAPLTSVASGLARMLDEGL